MAFDFCRKQLMRKLGDGNTFGKLSVTEPTLNSGDNCLMLVWLSVFPSTPPNSIKTWPKLAALKGKLQLV